MANTHDDVAHNWAHQTGRKNRGFNVFYDGDVIYSHGHHFMIAKHFVAPNGETVVLFNKESRSVSTSQHQAIVRRAASNLPIVEFDGDDVLRHPVADRAKREIEAIAASLPDLALKAQRARVHAAWHINTMRREISRANRIRDLFQITDIAPLEMPGDIAAFVAEYAAAEKAREAAREAANREKILEWLNGAAINPPHTKTPYVRVRGDIVETSWGVKVPLRRARALYRLARICKACGHEYVPHKRQLIDHWQIDRISADGTIKAGCHILPLAVQRRAAELAGVR